METKTEDVSKAGGDPVPVVSSLHRRREEKTRKRDPRALDNIIKTLVGLSDTEKLEAICKKYVDLYDEFRKTHTTYQSLEKTVTALQKEKEQLRTDQAKSVLARARLENLCRELQKQNKQIKEENIAKLKEEEERRKEVAGKFQQTLTEVTTMMNENKEKNFQLQNQNLDMTNKFSELYFEFQNREEDFKKISKQIDMEKQLAVAKRSKVEFELQAERELFERERVLMQNNLERSEVRNVQLSETMKTMEEQVKLYKKQYDDFESTLSKSNTVFSNCKTEMVKMSSQIQQLQKETQGWKSKFEESALSLKNLTKLKQAQDKEFIKSDKKIEQLQKLCRQLQVDRSAYIKLLKQNGIELTMTQVVPTEEEKPQTTKEKELLLLKDRLQLMQEKLVDAQKAAEEKVQNTETDNEPIETAASESVICDTSSPNDNDTTIKALQNGEVTTSEELLTDIVTNATTTIENGRCTNGCADQQSKIDTPKTDSSDNETSALKQVDSTLLVRPTNSTLEGDND